MSMFYPMYLCPFDSFFRGISLLDMKLGDVTGDGIIDKVSIYGNKPNGSDSGFADNITLVIQNGHCNGTKIITPKFNAGYNARLFLGDFNKNKINDIKLSMDSGGSGGYGIYYIYSFKDSVLKTLFDFEEYNKKYKYTVNYMDLYKVNVNSITLDKFFTLDINYKGYDYLSQYYDKNGKLKKAVNGEVLDLGALIPLAVDEKSNTYDLLAFQRTIGTYNADTLGYVQNMLTCDGQKFVPYNVTMAIPGTKINK